MTDRERLEKLLEAENDHRGMFGVAKDGRQVGRGRVPTHYKRCSIPEKRRDYLAWLGLTEIVATYLETSVYYTQALIAGAALSGDYDQITIVTPSQYGKLLADDTPVLTKRGWRNHGDLVVGDEVLAPDGRFVKVLHVHPKGFANRKVTLRTGDEFYCHEKHEWLVYDRDAHRQRVMETDAIRKRLGGGRSPFMIPVRIPMNGVRRPLKVDPYVMGVWLGDGSTSGGRICAQVGDLAVLDACRKKYPDGAEWVHKETGVYTRQFAGLQTDLGKYGLCRWSKKVEKFIPDDYLTASMSQRLKLLAGLIDTDGYLHPKDGRYYFVTAGRKLKDDFETLLSTFGWTFSTVEHQPTTSSSGIVGRSVYWTVGFNPTMEIPCVLPRKQTVRLSKQRGISIQKIEPCEPVQGNCITVEDGLYCVGRHLTTTHNSWLMGRLALRMAYDGHPMNVGGATEALTEKIMRQSAAAAATAADDVKKALTAEQLKKIDRLDQSLSKTRLSFPGKGQVQGVSLGDTFEDIERNKALGETGAWIIDEAALVSARSMDELGRREFSSIDGTVEPLIMISNPHKPGYFYDSLTRDPVPERECVIWADALTIAQEGRRSADKILTSKFAESRDTLQRYLLCELPTQGDGMFGVPVVRTQPKKAENVVRVMGVDAAYRGKDKIQVCYAEIEPDCVYFAEVRQIEKKEWIDGVTDKDIIEQVARIYHALGCEWCCVDIGFGVWLVGGLKRRGVNVVGINFGSGPTRERVKERAYSAVYAYNKRAEMHLDLQDMIDHRSCEFSPQVMGQIGEVLPLVSYEVKNSGKKQITAKQTIKTKIGHSPDAFDAVLLALHAAVLYSLGDVAYIVENDERYYLGQAIESLALFD